MKRSRPLTAAQRERLVRWAAHVLNRRGKPRSYEDVEAKRAAVFIVMNYGAPKRPVAPRHRGLR